MRMQVQPEYRSRAQWEQIAAQEGVTFEVLELSMPQVIAADFGANGQLGKEWYRSLSNITSLHGNFMDNNPASSDPDVAALSIRKLEESCRLAVEMGIPRVVFHSGAFPFLRGKYLERWASVSAVVYDRLAAEYDLQILVENSQDLDAEPLEQLMACVQDPRIGICLDIGHINYSREPVADWFGRLKDHVRYLHLSDNNGLFDEHLVLGSGTVDWKQVHELTARLPDETPVTLETGDPDKTRASIQFLREHGYFGL